MAGLQGPRPHGEPSQDRDPGQRLRLGLGPGLVLDQDPGHDADQGPVQEAAADQRQEVMEGLMP